MIPEAQYIFSWFSNFVRNFCLQFKTDHYVSTISFIADLSYFEHYFGKHAKKRRKKGRLILVMMLAICK